MKEVSKDFYSRNNANNYSEKVSGSSSYNSETGKTTVKHYEDK